MSAVINVVNRRVILSSCRFVYLHIPLFLCSRYFRRQETRRQCWASAINICPTSAPDLLFLDTSITHDLTYCSFKLTIIMITIFTIIAVHVDTEKTSAHKWSNKRLYCLLFIQTLFAIRVQSVGANSCCIRHNSVHRQATEAATLAITRRSPDVNPLSAGSDCIRVFIFY